MFEAAASMSSEQLTTVAYYTRLALERGFTPEHLRRHPILAGTFNEPSLADQEIACQWLGEIERHEGRRINELDVQTMIRYTGKLSGMALDRAEAERPVDPERAERLLEELRRAVPWPPLTLRRAG